MSENKKSKRIDIIFNTLSILILIISLIMTIFSLAPTNITWIVFIVSFITASIPNILNKEKVGWIILVICIIIIVFLAL